MNVPEEVVRGIATLAEGPLAADAPFHGLVDCTFAILTRERPKECLQECKPLLTVDPIIVKQGHSVLVSIVLEAAKENLDVSALKGLLEDQAMKPANVEYVCSRYEERVMQIRGTLLSHSTFNFPHIVALDWRLDFYIKSNSIERAPCPVYFIRLTTLETGGKTGFIEFTCSWEELQDLLNKLKDATKQVERSAAAFS
ncbi:HCaRG family protein [Pelomyxa schiedti]|nr:HCaRG family protein [Pelomyxa schiedti]